MSATIDSENAKHEIQATKRTRTLIADAVSAIELLAYKRETSLAKTKLEEGRMWLGKYLEQLSKDYPEFAQNP